MENVQRTIYGAYIQTCKMLGVPIQFYNYTTLNQYLNILPNYNYPSNANPIIQYLVVGNGGSTLQQGPGGIEVPVPIQHLATDANLYNMLPLVLRTLNNDLSTTDMANYRLKKIVTINGTQYIAYYGLLINLTNITVNMYSVTDNNGIATTQPFIPTALNLNPQPQELTALSANTVTGDYLNVSALANVNMTPAQIAEFINACNILYGNPYAAIISELGICSGFDVPNTISINNNETSYTEAVGVQINAFVNTFYAMYYSQNGLDLTYNIGASEPLMNLVNSNAT